MDKIESFKKELKELLAKYTAEIYADSKGMVLLLKLLLKWKG